MNILVIGNGFDLAHGLPTKYTDFLEFSERVKRIYEFAEWGSVENYKEKYIFDLKTNKEILDFLQQAVKNRRLSDGGKNKYTTNDIFLDEFYECINYNLWIKYFQQCDKYQKENWIDFESEISKVIQSVDTDIQRNGFDSQIDNLSNEYLKKNYLYVGFDALFVNENGKRCGKQNVTYKELRNKLLDDLNKLIRALEIYLTECVEQIDVKVVSPDIKEIAAVLHEDYGQKSILISKVISFNYTNTYERIYFSKHNIDSNDYIDFIHGKADITNIIETNNMVLGIDEFLPDDRKNNDIEFIAFKKFYQRIHKQTGCKYKNWVDGIRKDYFEHLQKLENAKSSRHNLYFFGHSLDVTDGDVLRDLILNDNVHTTIFYHNKDAMGQQITNLVKVIGQDELIKRTGGSTKTIEFKLQKPMEPINVKEPIKD